MKEKPSCFKCKFFRITWDPTAPYSCTYFGFKGKLLPSVTVKSTQGQECLAYTKKNN